MRLRAIAAGLLDLGLQTEILAPNVQPAMVDGRIPVYGLDRLDEKDRYEIIKTSYHDSIRLVPNGRKNVVSRIVRVVDEAYPRRDERFRASLLQCQRLIAQKAHTVIFNNEENRSRWINMYGDAVQTALVPTGCPSVIPAPGFRPYRTHKKVLLFLGSIASARMLTMLNNLAIRLSNFAEIHLVGSNKTLMYGDGTTTELNPLIVNHGPKCEIETWDYIYHADIGLALAAGPEPFDNDISKIYTYLRGGLPVLSEEPILNNSLIRRLGFGRVFNYGDMDGLVYGCKALLSEPPTEKRKRVMSIMIKEHSWEERAARYKALFEKIAGIKLSGNID
ncbi:MAG: hypothetical protein ACP5U1_02625 [Desulfomonilaceae bacterium]